VILVVDDFADGARALSYLLMSRGATSHPVFSGPEALAMMREAPPTEPLLVILDDMMPEMSGLEVLRAIQADPKLRRAVVVMFSAALDPAREAEARQLGAAAWFEKGAMRGRDATVLVRSMLAFYPLAEASARIAAPNTPRSAVTSSSPHLADPA
jgi:CheY-like chemotaxis protein